MSDLLTIRNLIERVQSGTIRIPKFQRGFVWEPENIAFLMDSVYRGYPIGSVLFWRTTEQLTGERNLGPFQLPEPAKKWPIDYVLDGQQRLTTLFGVFQTTLKPHNTALSFDVYFDLDAKEGALEDQFISLAGTDVPPKNYFPLRLLLDPTPFALASRDLKEADLARVVELQRRFQEAQLKSEIIEFDDREQIAMIFERVNRAGIPLDTFQLLTAWTWSEEFDLNERIENLGSEVASYGFSRIGEQQDLLLKCSAAVINGDASVKSIVKLHGPTVRDRFSEISRGIFGAIEFIRNELNVHSLEIMPYPAMLVPLTRFFSTASTSGFHPSAKQREALKEWFWRPCFSRRYSSGVGKAHEADLKFMDTLKADETTRTRIPLDTTVGHICYSDFNIGTVNTKIFVLMLATTKPRSLISNSVIDLEDTLLRCNRNEFHHIFPKAYLLRTFEEQVEALEKEKDKDDYDGYEFYGKNWLLNFCFLSSADNQTIKDKAPTEYIKLIPQNLHEKLFKEAFLPLGWFDLEYKDFTDARLKLIDAHIKALCGAS
ncbi:MAG: DUF262 domain-containing protein [Afipia sp.]|nr:DUF262 domain-containing protein [Afipia sp.]